MGVYVPLREIPGHFGLSMGDSVWIASDVKTLLYSCMEHGEKPDLNELIEGIIDCIGADGTILIPTFNWDFCKGKAFDIRKTPCRTGTLGKVALQREDFKRTQHPIYSFAVWGRDRELLSDMTNKSSFGADSPFSYCRERNAKNVFIDVECQHSFTFVHYVEEQEGVSYRYLKDFTAPYIDWEGNESIRTYSMNVRDLDKDIFVTIYPFEEDFLREGITRRYKVNDIPMKTLEIGRTYPIIAEDVRNNRSRKICTFKGQ
ncbi:MAG: AAC(3) family N-acetyltransferase [Lachnospiraceae bacterium]|nr:AAC(3) family N-acetyltransferase [Lachnospiraceae bacterium]